MTLSNKTICYEYVVKQCVNHCNNVQVSYYSNQLFILSVISDTVNKLSKLSSKKVPASNYNQLGCI